MAWSEAEYPGSRPLRKYKKMAKALFGHVATSSDVHLLEELSRLRRRVNELEQELSAARADRDQIAASLRVGDEDLIRLSDLEHARI
ncbi:MAG: hypothetical protein WCB04_07245 [Mycobacteriales bacterium]